MCAGHRFDCCLHGLMAQERTAGAQNDCENGK